MQTFFAAGVGVSGKRLLGRKGWKSRETFLGLEAVSTKAWVGSREGHGSHDSGHTAECVLKG